MRSIPEPVAASLFGRMGRSATFKLSLLAAALLQGLPTVLSRLCAFFFRSKVDCLPGDSGQQVQLIQASASLSQPLYLTAFPLSLFALCLRRSASLPG